MRRFDALLVEMKEMESVCKALQLETTSLSGVLFLFEGVIEKHSVPADNLGVNADIVHSATIKNTVDNLQPPNHIGRTGDNQEIL